MSKIDFIKIYYDNGVERNNLPLLLNELSNKNVGFISSQEIMQTSWESQTSLLIIPGGRDVPYHKALNGEGNRRIKKYVENGGAFLGICAGAYYGCGAVEFDRGMEREVMGLRELAFFPGIARGPVYGPGSFRYHSEFGAQAAMISNSFDEEILKSYYNGGCYFVDAERYSHVKLISKYLEIQGTPAAIIEVSVGEGIAILSGVHIEMGTSHPSKALTKKMAQALLPYEKQRKHLFQHLLNRLLNIHSEIH